jgi:hypothetical protein
MLAVVPMLSSALMAANPSEYPGAAYPPDITIASREWVSYVKEISLTSTSS